MERISHGDINMNQSYWQKTSSIQRCASIQDDMDTDIVIIGAGMAGVSLAYQLKDLPYRVIVVDKDQIASHTSGHTTAKLTVLHGKIYPGAEERISSAPFDEKLSVLGLLVSALSDGARNCYEWDIYAERLFGILKFVKGQPDLLEGLSEAFRQEKDKWEKSEHGKTMEKSEIRVALRLMNTLEEYLGAVREGADFEAVKNKFNEAVAGRQSMLEQWKTAFDNSFTFVEGAFGESQEMVVFITELNSSHYALWFIGENGCEKYYQYNQGLLLSERQSAIMSDIQGIEKELSFLGSGQ